MADPRDNRATSLPEEGELTDHPGDKGRPLTEDEKLDEQLKETSEGTSDPMSYPGATPGRPDPGAPINDHKPDEDKDEG